jgi:galactose oxidase
MALNRKITTDQDRPPIVVGVTPSCPYGIGACWGGAFDALQRLSNIEVVRPVSDAADSIAFVYLQRDILPDLDVWRDQFAKVINGTYIMRGIEMTLSGLVTEEFARLTLSGTATRPDLVLAPLQAADKIQWDIRTRANRPMTDAEASEFARLSAALVARPAGATVQVTGPLKKNGTEFFLEVRQFVVDSD